ncbi:hypothetical protein OB955_22595 [Halobacteria archaeon AArc-m2/3/4]|uniref:Beta-mannosidase-like galactose-binding domain-containing protein n=1 Tax=Natronoglomus mannanivorans TaxID=2979990 RepID=A0ABT2QKL4_9EURY|nr:hypothetical protein [Halobacteria archaeon AArc-m2/3/4]
MTANDREALSALAAEFLEPRPEHGPVPQWWLDGDSLDDERLTEQLEALSENGVTGVCLISKLPTGHDGTTPGYFTEEWWSHVEHIAAECERLDMELWIHDETYHHNPPTWWEYWQNRIRTEAATNDELRGHAVHREGADVAAGESITVDLPEEFDPLSVAAYPRGDEGRLDLDGAVELGVEDGRVTWSAPDGPTTDHDTWHVAAVGRRPADLRYTSSETVERYIDLHYEEYVRRLGDQVGETLVGTFEDELRILNYGIPCDDAVLDRFRQDRGYDPTSELIALYEECEETARVRTDYYDVVVSLLEENWFEPLYEWHEEHDMKRANDNYGRNNIAQGTELYGDYYRTMRWYQAPGYDDGAPKAIGERNFFDAKLAASIAACYDRDYVWGELFHSTTWGFRPDNQLAGIVENVCYGCSRYDKHGLYYTTLGGWWAHAPPDVHFRQPYWEDVGALNDAATRLSRLFSDGTPDVDVALAFPVRSMHADWHPEEGIGDRGTEIDERTRDLAAGLYGDGMDLVIADDESLVDAADEGHLELSGMRIPALVLPPSTAIAADTLRTAVNLFESGGVVVASGRLPTTVVDDGTGGADLDDALETLFGDAVSAARSGEISDRTVTEHPSGGATILAPSGADVADEIRSHVETSVRVDAPDVYHTHRTVAGGEGEAYLLFNARDEEREIGVELRGDGRPERWDPLTGETTPIREYDRVDDYLRFEFDVGPHDFRVVVVDETASADRPHVRESELDVVKVDADAVRGYATAGGTVTVEATDGERTYRGRTESTAPDAVTLTDDWEFELVPTLDNHWGDFRYPASDDVIGPEVKALSYRRERPNEDGIERGWHRPTARISRWEEVRPTYGPYFYRMQGTTDEGPETMPDDLEFDAGASKWEPYEFSQTTGKPGINPYLMGYMGAISDYFLVSPPANEDDLDATYFWTTVDVPEDGFYRCYFGPGVTTVRLGAYEFETEQGQEADWGVKIPRNDGGYETSIQLPAGTTPLLLTVEPDVETYAAFEPEPGTALERDASNTPRLRWFFGDGMGGVRFDPRPQEDSVGWYRFDAPVGTAAFSLPLEGDARVWIDGEERSIEDASGDARVELPEPLRAPTTVAVRVEQARGAYGGAAWMRPIAVETEPVSIAAENWPALGLTSYSGRAVYRQTFDLPAFEDGDRVTLVIDDVVSAASVTLNDDSVGSVFSRPFSLDVSGVVTPGENLLEIEVGNSLANHFKRETPIDYTEQYARNFVSPDAGRLPEVDEDVRLAGGLRGPVTVRIEPEVEIKLDAK